MKINDIPMNSGWSGSSQNTNTYASIGTMQISMSRKLYFPNKFKFSMSFETLHGIKGNWDFKFIVSRNALNKETKSFAPNLKVKIKNATIKIKNVSLTPINTTIIFDSNTNLEYTNWIVLDDKGNELSEKGGEMSKRFYTDYECTNNFTKVNGTPKYLTVVPYSFSKISDESKDILIALDSKLPFKASQGNNGSITITKITNSGDKVTITAIAKGNFPQTQMSYAYLHGLDSKVSSEVHTKKISSNKYEFTMEYSNLNKNKPYKIRVKNLDFIDYNSKFIIPLK